MIPRLQSLLPQAESLAPDAQHRIADAIEREVAREAGALSPEEVAALEWVLARHAEGGPEPTDEEIIAAAGEEAEFTPEELAELDRIMEEPFVAADPEDLARLFAHRG